MHWHTHSMASIHSSASILLSRLLYIYQPLLLSRLLYIHQPLLLSRLFGFLSLYSCHGFLDSSASTPVMTTPASTPQPLYSIVQQLYSFIDLYCASASVNSPASCTHSLFIGLLFVLWLPYNPQRLYSCHSFYSFFSLFIINSFYSFIGLYSCFSFYGFLSQGLHLLNWSQYLITVCIYTSFYSFIVLYTCYSFIPSRLLLPWLLQYYTT